MHKVGRRVALTNGSHLAGPTSSGRSGIVSGFTIIEILLAMCILGTLAAIAVPSYQHIVEKAKVAKAIGDISAFGIDIQSANTLPASLDEVGRGQARDPWGNPYRYLRFDPTKQNPPGARKDRFLVPINSTFDLYSMGKDGATAIPLTAAASHDDIVRANDGGFIGLAENF